MSAGVLTLPPARGGAARRLGVLASLCVAQGLPFGFFTQALPVRMREQGVGLGAIGLTALLALPWALELPLPTSLAPSSPLDRSLHP